MIRFEDKYFKKINFSKEQIEKNLKNALKDLDIAKRDKILEVKFAYSYNALIKAGITLLSLNQVKIKSMPGHHAKNIETMAQMLGDESIADIGNIMRSKRNMDLYVGGVEITEKECLEYLSFVERVLARAKEMVLVRIK